MWSFWTSCEASAARPKNAQKPPQFKRKHRKLEENERVGRGKKTRNFGWSEAERGLGQGLTQFVRTHSGPLPFSICFYCFCFQSVSFAAKAGQAKVGHSRWTAINVHLGKRGRHFARHRTRRGVNKVTFLELPLFALGQHAALRFTIRSCRRTASSRSWIYIVAAPERLQVAARVVDTFQDPHSRREDLGVEMWWRTSRFPRCLRTNRPES